MLLKAKNIKIIKTTTKTQGNKITADNSAIIM